MDIERMATSAVSQLIAKTDYLSPYVNSGDSEPSWDGNIYAYSDLSKEKSSLIGKAPVQVKGRSCERFSDDVLKFPVSTADLRNYKTDGGALFFVVQINHEQQTKIYYNSLLPYEINNLLDGAEHNETISVSFYEMPSSHQEVSSIVLNFVRDKSKQTLLQNSKNISLENLVSENNLKDISFDFSYTALGYDPANRHEYLFNHDVYIYAKKKEFNIDICVPIQHMWRTELIKAKYHGPVSINDTSYYDTFDLIRKPDLDIIELGKSISLSLYHNGSSVVNYKLKGTLPERIKAKQFMLSLLENKKAKINGVDFQTAPTKDELEACNIKEAKLLLDYMIEIQDILDKLDVHLPLDCDQLSEKDEKYLRMLFLAFTQNKSFHFNKPVPPIACLTIGNLKILLSFKEQDDGSYKIESFTENNNGWSSDYNTGEMFSTSKYTIFQKDDFIGISNFNYTHLLNDMKRFDNEGNYQRCLLSMLEILKAYDDTKRSELLNTATAISLWLYKKWNMAPISVINLFQCYIRQRPLSPQEEDQLMNIIEDDKDNYPNIVGCYILLSNEKMVIHYLNKLSDSDKQNFKEHPIWTLIRGKVTSDTTAQESE